MFSNVAVAWLIAGAEPHESEPLTHSRSYNQKYVTALGHQTQPIHRMLSALVVAGGGYNCDVVAVGCGGYGIMSLMVARELHTSSSIVTCEGNRRVK